MSRVLLRSNAFVRAAKKILHKKPEHASDVKDALTLLEEDAFQLSLRTHKLTGSLKGSWACSAGYDLRIVFSFVKYEGREAILIETIGNHDEVY